MREKSKETLKGEIFGLKTQCEGLIAENDTLKKENKNIEEKYVYTLYSFSDAVKISLLRNPDKWVILAEIVMQFFANMKRKTGMDFSDERIIDSVLNIIEFDQVTSISIKTNISHLLVIEKMYQEGKTEKEIIEFLKKMDSENTG